MYIIMRDFNTSNFLPFYKRARSKSLWAFFVPILPLISSRSLLFQWILQSQVIVKAHFYRNVYFPVNCAVILYWLYFTRKHLILQDFSKENFHQRYLAGSNGHCTSMVSLSIRRGSIEITHNYVHAFPLFFSARITGTAMAQACGMPLSTFRYRAEIYGKAKVL